MSGQKWPLGSEVKRKELTGGVMLYDASRAGNAAAAWFDVSFWRERGELDGEARGRGTTHFIRTGSGKQHFVLRHYRRGGLVARVLKDRYFWRNESVTRAFAEWQLLYHLHRAGLPVPAPVACRYRRQGLTYTADIITERLMDSMSLAEALRKRGLPILGWITIGRCIRAFHDLGVCHPDLNAHNIMLVGDDSVYLIDFDRGQLRKPGMWCDGNLVRLRRSLEKITYRMPPEHFSEADWHGFLDGYRQSGGMPGAPRPPGGGGDSAGTTTSRVLSVATDFPPASAAVPAAVSTPVGIVPGSGAADSAPTPALPAASASQSAPSSSLSGALMASGSAVSSSSPSPSSEPSPGASGVSGVVATGSPVSAATNETASSAPSAPTA